MKTFEGKNAVLTGGSRGIGPHIARALAAEGVNVCLVARTQADLETVSASLKELPGSVSFFVADIADTRQQAAILDHTRRLFGALHILVNNAAVFPAGPFDHLTEDVIRNTVTTNLVGPMQLTHRLLPLLCVSAPAQVVTLASLGGKKGPLYQATYAATKAGLIEWMSALRLEYEDRHVGFSTIIPSFVTEAGMFARYQIDAPVTVGRCTPGQVARAVVKAIRKNQAEVIVNTLPVRPLLALYALFPAFGNWYLKASGVAKFLRTHMNH